MYIYIFCLKLKVMDSCPLDYINYCKAIKRLNVESTLSVGVSNNRIPLVHSEIHALFNDNKYNNYNLMRYE